MCAFVTDGFTRDPSSGGGVSSFGDWSLIEEKSGVAASYDFQSIPGTFRALVLLGQIRGDHADALRSARLTFNADGGANYSNQVRQITGTTTTGTTLTTGDTDGYFAPLPSAGATAAHAAVFQAIIPNYAGSDFQKHCMVQSVASSSVTVTYLFELGIHWYSTAPITRITIGPDAGAQYVAGSKMALYGIK